jgi:hypothetical protein
MMVRSFWVGLLVVAACATGGDTPPATNEVPPEEEPSATPCSPAEPCEGAEACHNGVCAARCTMDGECDEGSFCDADDTATCQPTVVTSCPETPCAETQFCASGMCATQAAAACQHSPFDPKDGCGDAAVCMATLFVDGMPVDIESCYTFPPCAPDYSCPVGEWGAVCSFGVLHDKQAMCVPGMCLGDENCPDAFRCIKPPGGQVYGFCGDGRSGGTCAAGTDCTAGICDAPAVGYLGRCL